VQARADAGSEPSALCPVQPYNRLPIACHCDGASGHGRRGRRRATQAPARVPAKSISYRIILPSTLYSVREQAPLDGRPNEPASRS